MSETVASVSLILTCVSCVLFANITDFSVCVTDIEIYVHDFDVCGVNFDC